ncbi:MAG: hypothetical protein O7C59_11315 [Rickettsia endosymbiont of Ixodes persulcatus]|nr:hypothetical protein [Rickettsia endosymbiont of Ixodes persulcatus]MCZ6914951.1 hypothetical protein [Rickettsia endosymbiont of Ixodes persulcatus]MCZ6919326.1 hypothetical protein [Rickettsia endosymbiont of Ixodes persulcatus]
MKVVDSVSLKNDNVKGSTDEQNPLKCIKSAGDIRNGMLLIFRSLYSISQPLARNATEPYILLLVF